MAISATASKNVYATASPNKYPWKFTVSFEETEVSGSADNTSTIKVTGTMYGKNIYYTNHDNRNLYVYWYDDQDNQEGTLVAQKQDISSTTKGKAITIEGSITVPHKADGTLNGYAQLKFDGSSGSSSLAAKDTTLNTDETALTSISRYLDITKFQESYKDETTIKIDWATSSTCSQLVIYNNNVEQSTLYPNATSGTFSVSTSAGSSNTIYIVCRNAASSLDTASDSYTIKTYYFPHVTSVGTANWVIGNNQTVSIYNPLGHTFQLYMTDKNGTIVWQNDNATGTSVTIPGSAINSAQLYKSIPNTTSGTAYYYCKYKNSNQTASKTSNYLCNPSACKPVVNTTNFQYKDVSDSAQSVIKDNQILVQGHSKLAIHFEQTSGKNSATIKKYKISFGGDTAEYTTHCGSGVFVTPFNKVVSQSGNTNISLTVVDSRGYTSAPVTLPVTIRAWSKPTVAVTANRKNDFEKETTLNVTVTNYSLLKNSSGQEINAANKSISYTCTNNATNTVVSSGDITSTLTKTLNLNQEQSFTFAVTISDSFGATYATTSEVVVNKGTPIMMIDGENLGVGINCFPEGSGLYVDGDIYSRGVKTQLKSYYFIDATDLDSTKFYPVIFSRTQSMIDCEIHSESGNGSKPYNQNVIHFQMISQGWSDTPPCFAILQYNVYSATEITIGCIGRGTSIGDNCVWIRGGLSYDFYSNIKPVLYETDYDDPEYTENKEIFSVGTNYYGGTNTRVDILFTPQTTITKGAYFSNLTLNNNDFLNKIYPIGTIYMSIENTSPASFIGGNWTPLKDRFLIGAGNSYSKEATGGYSTITLTAAQSGLRDHVHPASYSGANFYIRHGKTIGTATVKAGVNTSVENGVGDVWSNGFDTAEYSHNIDRVNIGGTVSVTGSGTLNAAEAHSNMPPYLAVYMWKRIS